MNKLYFKKVQIRIDAVRRLKARRWKRPGLVVKGRVTMHYVSLTEVINKVLDDLEEYERMVEI